MWAMCCCRDSIAVKEPQRKIKNLELIHIEVRHGDPLSYECPPEIYMAHSVIGVCMVNMKGHSVMDACRAPCKLRMKATWTVGNKATKYGLMKVYGENHLKSWAQEIVILGMMRRTQHPSLLQCLWTNNSNPYYEAIAFISGEIITIDSRIICLELTNVGTLQDFLKKTKLPIPEPCQRKIIHDIAEGLFHLHHENILHNKLTSSCVYLKGSLQSTVLRAAVGDFENAKIYGTLQQSLSSSITDKQYFFLPDIRSFALIALEIVSSMCEKQFQNQHVTYNSDDVPMTRDLEQVISEDVDDDDDEYESQYCYNVEDTDSVCNNVLSDENNYDSDTSEEICQHDTQNCSLENAMDQTWSMSPDFNERPKQRSDQTDKVQISNSECERATKNDTILSKINGQFLSVESNPSAEMKRNSERFTNSGLYNAHNVKSKKENNSLFSKRLNSTQNKLLSPKAVEHNAEQVRCASPDPMEDQTLQKLRKETKLNIKRSKTEVKRSVIQTKIEENVSPKPLLEAFVKSGVEQEVTHKEGKSWLSKPSLLLKSIANNDTAVSVFKAKAIDGENYSTLDAIEEEDLSQSTAMRTKQLKAKVKNKAEVRDIIDEQYCLQVSKKASNKLKKTISSESRSSLWSFISTPDDMNEDDLDDILQCLPGMVETSNQHITEPKIEDIIAERENATKREDAKMKFSFKDLSKSKFELIDYYEMLKAKKITLKDVPEDKRELLLNAIELKKEAKMKRDMLYGKGVLRNDEMYNNDTIPISFKSVESPSLMNGCIKTENCSRNQCHILQQNALASKDNDPRIERPRCAPLKRPRTPMYKVEQSVKPRKINQTCIKNKALTLAKRNKARVALKHALNTQSHQILPRYERTINAHQPDMNVKLATVRKITVNSVDNDKGNGKDFGNLIQFPILTSPGFSITNNKPKYVDMIRQSSSASGYESASSLESSVCQKRTDVSLTSGEMSSLSSQADSDHYETDAHLTDTDINVSENSPNERFSRIPYSSRVDSGFDSGYVSSEISDTLISRNKTTAVSLQNTSNGIMNSWARNYNMVNNLSMMPNDFYIQGHCNENSVRLDHLHNDLLNHATNIGCMKNNVTDTDSRVSTAIYSRMLHAPSFKDAISPSMSELSCIVSTNNGPTSSLTRFMTPPSRTSSTCTHQCTYQDRQMPAFNQSKSHTNQHSLPNSRLASSQLCTLSPNALVLSASTLPITTKSRPTSPTAWIMSPRSRPISPHSRPMSPHRHQMSPHNHPMPPTGQPVTANVLPTNNYVMASRCDKSVKSCSRALSTKQQNQLQIETTPFSLGRKLSKHSNSSSSENPILQRTQTDLQRNSATICNKVNIETICIKEDNVVGTAAFNAARRYRQFVEQGVPLRTTVIESRPSRLGPEDEKHNSCKIEVRPGTSDSINEDGKSDQELFENLQSNGFFTSPNSSPSPLKILPTKRSPRTKIDDAKIHAKRRNKKKIPLDKLVQEVHNSYPYKAHRSSSLNHLAVTQEVFLNQPTSDDSETCSIKTNKSCGSTTPKLLIDAETVIDRMFSQNQRRDFHLDVEKDVALALDKDLLNLVQEHCWNDQQPQNIDLEHVALLNGISQMHIHGCNLLSSSISAIYFGYLLTASEDNFDHMTSRLQQMGKLGAIGSQLLDIVRKCWLQDIPPALGDLVEKLSDPVTETEL